MKACELHSIIRCTICLDLYPEERYQEPDRSNEVEKVRYEVSQNEVERIFANLDRGTPFIFHAHPLYHADHTTGQRLRSTTGQRGKDEKRARRVKYTARQARLSVPSPNGTPTRTTQQWAEELGVTL